MKLLRTTMGIMAVLLLTGAATAEPHVKLGNEVLAETNFKALAGKRVGLITNPSGINSRLESTIDVLRNAPDVKLVALFGPEHGIYGDVPAGDKALMVRESYELLPSNDMVRPVRPFTIGPWKLTM